MNNIFWLKNPAWDNFSTKIIQNSINWGKQFLLIDREI